MIVLLWLTAAAMELVAVVTYYLTGLGVAYISAQLFVILTLSLCTLLALYNTSERNRP